tara:strand:- start:669 stop:812 length:144 start_codon:yes stop_codon:yes gene_type:complete
MIKNVIVEKANTADLIKSTVNPAFNSKPIILIGMPYFIRLKDNFSEA